MPDEVGFKYSVTNALLWGNCKENFKKANSETLSTGRRFAYGLLGAAQVLPIISQLVSFAEWGIHSAHEAVQAKQEVAPKARDTSDKTVVFASKKLQELSPAGIENKQAGSLKICVQHSLNGEKTNTVIGCKRGTTVFQLKQQIESDTGVPAQDQDLILNAKSMEDDASIDGDLLKELKQAPYITVNIK
jgi:Ubiquitin family